MKIKYILTSILLLFVTVLFAGCFGGKDTYYSVTLDTTHIGTEGYNFLVLGEAKKGDYTQYKKGGDIEIVFTVFDGWELKYDMEFTSVYSKIFIDLTDTQKEEILELYNEKIAAQIALGKTMEQAREIVIQTPEFKKYMPLPVTWTKIDAEDSFIEYRTSISNLSQDLVVVVDYLEKSKITVYMDTFVDDDKNPNYNLNNYNITINNEEWDIWQYNKVALVDGITLKIAPTGDMYVPEVIFYEWTQYNLYYSSSGYAERHIELVANKDESGNIIIGDNGEYTFHLGADALLSFSEEKNIVFSLRDNLYEDLIQKRNLSIPKTRPVEIYRVNQVSSDGVIEYVEENYYKDKFNINTDLYIKVELDRGTRFYLGENYNYKIGEILLLEIRDSEGNAVEHDEVLCKTQNDITTIILRVQKENISSDLIVDIDYELYRWNETSNSPYENGNMGETNFGLIQLELVNDRTTTTGMQYKDNIYFVIENSTVEISIDFKIYDLTTDDLTIILKDLSGNIVSADDLNIVVRKEATQFLFQFKIILENYNQPLSVEIVIGE